MNLAEEFALLTHDDDGKSVAEGADIDNGLGGALLLELALAGKVDVRDKKVVVLDAEPTGDPLVDVALNQIARDSTPRKPSHWVGQFAKNAREQVMQRLVAAGVVRRDEDKVLWVFPRTLYPAVDGVEPAAEAEARVRMRTAVTSSGPVEPRTAALCALVAATGLDKKVFHDLDTRQVKARLKEIGEGNWAATAVKKVIEEIQVMLAMVVVTAAVTAAT